MEAINKLQAYNKAIAAGVVGVVAVIASLVGITVQPEVEAALLTLITVFIVWLVPNR